MHARLGTTALLSLLLVGVACSSSPEVTDGDRATTTGDKKNSDGDGDGGSGTSSGGKSSSSGGKSSSGGGKSSSGGGGSSGSDACAANEERCPRGCAALATDMNNCGSCGNACPTFAGVQSACVDGECQTSCSGATDALCQNDEQQLVCIDIANDPQHCGGCANRPCDTVENGTPTCEGGRCGTRCNTGLSACHGGSACLDLQNDELNCGSCNRRCLTNRPDDVVLDECSGGQCRGTGERTTAADCAGGVCSPRTCEQLCDDAFVSSSSTGGRIGYRNGSGFSTGCDVAADVPLDQVAPCDARYTIPVRYTCQCRVDFTW